jgi:hypothetical protein
VYEQQGVGASTEIQQAARRVVEENRRLRAFLHEHGIDESSIGNYLQSPNASPSQGPASAEEGASQALDRLLAPRHPSFDANTTPLLPTTGFDLGARRHSMPYTSTSVGVSVNGARLSLAIQEMRHATASANYEPLGLSNDTQTYRHDLSASGPSERQAFDAGKISMSATIQRPTTQLSRQAISDPTGLWTESPQMSPISSVSIQTNQAPEGHSYLSHAIPYSSHQPPGFSAAWPSQLSSCPSSGSSGIFGDGLTSLVPTGPTQSDGPGERLEEHIHHQLDDTSQKRPAENMQ